METEAGSKIEKIANGGLKASLLLLALSAPISIAATQTAWALAILFWLLRQVFVWRAIRIDHLGAVILCFVGLSLISSLFSYEPEVSLRKMVAVSLVSIVYLVVDTVNDRRLVKQLVVLLVTACVASCLYTFTTQAIGKNLKVLSMTAESPLRAAGVKENDTILKVGDRDINAPEDLNAATSVDNAATVPILLYRHELLIKVDLAIGPWAGTARDLGIVNWSRGRDTRAAGFYGHYTTFAESLQLIGSVALGLLVFLPGGPFARNRLLLTTAFAAIAVALFLTVTRASWAGFAIAAGVIVLFGAKRRTIVICGLLMVPIAAAGLLYLQQTRNVSFIDMADGSTTWRATVWREAVNVLGLEPRHMVVGIGMDSLKTHWQDWNMFDNGRQPVGHLHSTPLQIAFERGLPALIVWMIWMFVYLRILIRGLRSGELDWFERGVLLGCLGGTIGFLASGLVHYNWGDSEVVMILYLLMGLSLAVIRLNKPAVPE